MSVEYYFDENVPRAIAEGLRLKGIDVLTVQEDGFDQRDDPVVLDRATELGRVVFTFDDDFLREATARSTAGSPFATVIYAPQLRMSIGRCIDDLELFAGAVQEDEIRSRVYHLPLH